MALSTYTSGSSDGSGYNIKINFQGSNWTTANQQAFIDAADELSTIITGDLTSHNGVDDLEINAQIRTIDGSGGVLGMAGPTSMRSFGEDKYLPSKGVMYFDIADANSLIRSGGWETVVLHEMFHVLGFGVIWDDLNLIRDVSPGSSVDYRFTGKNAMHEYEQLFPGKFASDPNSHLGVPVESSGGSGTAGSHWDEEVFGKEMMTGYYNPGTYMSNMTIGALEDMGYETTYKRTGICFLAGTRILTAKGERPIEELCENDLIYTQDRGYQKLRMLVQSRVVCESEDQLPLCIKPGALGNSGHHSPLFVSPLHRILLDGEFIEAITGEEALFVKARHLDGLVEASPEEKWLGKELRYFNLLFDNHEIIIANGLRCESFFAGREALLNLSRPEAMLVMEKLGGMAAGAGLELARPSIGGAKMRQIMKAIARVNELFPGTCHPLQSEMRTGSREKQEKAA